MTHYHDGGQVPLIPKVAAEDAILTVSNVEGGMTTFPVSSGTEIDIHVPGLHYNRTLCGTAPWGQVLMSSHSALLGATSQIHARAIPWRLAKGRVSSIQSRYILPRRDTVIMTHEHFAGARACLGRRCELSYCS